MVRDEDGGWGPTGVGGAECLVSNHNTASHTPRYSDTPVAGEWSSPLPDPVLSQALPQSLCSRPSRGYLSESSPRLRQPLIVVHSAFSRLGLASPSRTPPGCHLGLLTCTNWSWAQYGGTCGHTCCRRTQTGAPWRADPPAMRNRRQQSPSARSFWDGSSLLAGRPPSAVADGGVVRTVRR